MQFSKEIKKYARIITKQAQNKGLIPKPVKCQICGYDREMLAEEKAGLEEWGDSGKSDKWLIDNHHPDYSQPFEVWHLCKHCHKKLHIIQNQRKEVIRDLRIAKTLILLAESSV